MDGGDRVEEFIHARDGYVSMDCGNCPKTFGEKGFCPLTKTMGGGTNAIVGLIGVVT